MVGHAWPPASAGRRCTQQDAWRSRSGSSHVSRAVGVRGPPRSAALTRRVLPARPPGPRRGPRLAKKAAPRSSQGGGRQTPKGPRARPGDAVPGYPCQHGFATLSPLNATEAGMQTWGLFCWEPKCPGKNATTVDMRKRRNREKLASTTAPAAQRPWAVSEGGRGLCSLPRGATGLKTKPSGSQGLRVTSLRGSAGAMPHPTVSREPGQARVSVLPGRGALPARAKQT